ncbi:MAG: hypothetical protein KKB30_17215 [Proteobacteria bacterium]|nr:hypothetical protein [Pseudomonadota bacterium]
MTSAPGWHCGGRADECDHEQLFCDRAAKRGCGVRGIYAGVGGAISRVSVKLAVSYPNKKQGEVCNIGVEIESISAAHYVFWQDSG